jgi:hypothetical protein
MQQRPNLRAADADRERTATDLREHYAAGRLSEPELGERIDAAYAARTVAELDALTADLPDARPLPAPPSGRAVARRRVYQDAGAVVIINVACVAIWAISGAGHFWPVWVMLISCLRLARDAWRLMGPASDLPPLPRGRRHRSRR